MLLLLCLSLFGCQNADAKGESVTYKGIVATYFAADAPVTERVVLVFGGSGGGIYTANRMANTFSKSGVNAMAVAYFGVQGLPQQLANIDLNYFEKAFEYVVSKKGISREKIALMGISRGAELALLLGSTYQIGPVVAYAPSSVLWGPCCNDFPSGTVGWQYNEKPLPHARQLPYQQPNENEYHGTPQFMKSLQGQDLSAATIKVENIPRGIILVSGEDDQLWPSTFMANQIMDRLHAKQYKYPFKHLSYEGAGHVISPGARSNIQRSTLANGYVIIMGGSSAANAKAQQDSWPQVIEFISSKQLME
ncbi:acyl-CoA thioester hydrolase/BAAT C-terminal domain-containing protein [Thalassotalea agarivorans]|nr:acyl-CoA thioester hydrolase/BAAT C-terminal domain-containing protein [Thalassotalea agarivorans]